MPSQVEMAFQESTDTDNTMMKENSILMLCAGIEIKCKQGPV